MNGLFTLILTFLVVFIYLGILLIAILFGKKERHKRIELEEKLKSYTENKKLNNER